jgi:hypothetical protein
MLEMRVPGVRNCEHPIEINKDAFRECSHLQRDSSHVLSRGNAAEILDLRSGQRLRHRAVDQVRVQANFLLLDLLGNNDADRQVHTRTDKGENTSHPKEEGEGEESDDNGANHEAPRLICISGRGWNASMIGLCQLYAARKSLRVSHVLCTSLSSSHEIALHTSRRVPVASLA